MVTWILPFSELGPASGDSREKYKDFMTRKVISSSLTRNLHASLSCMEESLLCPALRGWRGGFLGRLGSLNNVATSCNNGTVQLDI